MSNATQNPCHCGVSKWETEIKVLVDAGAIVNVIDEVVEVMERFALVSN